MQAARRYTLLERVAPDQFPVFGWRGEVAFAQANAFAPPDEFDLVRQALTRCSDTLLGVFSQLCPRDLSTVHRIRPIGQA